MESLRGLGTKERAQLTAILKANRSFITPAIASKALGLEQNRTAQLLARWAKKGWVSRVKRGVYIPVPLQSESVEVRADEPWVLAMNLFSPCYVGGWSAANHWELTEQLFSTTMIFTSKKISGRELNYRGMQFHLRLVKPNRLFGLKEIWLGDAKVTLSDPARTIVDAFNDPTVVGGIRMTADVFTAYLRSSHKNLDLMFEYAQRMGNSAILKRLGYFLELFAPAEVEAIGRCKANLRSGNSQLDPSSPGKRLVTKWRLWIPASWKIEGDA